MNTSTDDPRCPECGGKIGQTATYCMHCSADLTEEQVAADVDGDETWERQPDGTRPSPTAGPIDALSRALSDAFGGKRDTDGRQHDGLLHPDGIVDDTLTVVVGIVGGLLVGIVATFELLFLTGSAWGFGLGLVTWLGVTAYLVRRRTVQGAVAASGYAIAAALLLVPLLAFSPVAQVEGGLESRGGMFVALTIFVVVPVAIAGAVGWLASRFVPESVEPQK